MANRMTTTSSEKLKTKTRELLEDRLRSSGPPRFTYTEFRDLLERKTRKYFAVRDKKFHDLLCDVCRETEREGIGLISVIVVHASGDRRPGPEFFKLAEELGRNVTDRETFWNEEKKRVKDHYRPRTVR